MTGGYGIVYREIMRCKELTPEAKAIYAYLCSFAGCNTSCYPGADMMKRELQMSADRFYKHMRLLTERGIVTKSQERKGNRWGRTIYTLNHTPDFQLSQNEDTENQLSQNEDTQKQNTQNKQTNNNSHNNNSYNNNTIKSICDLLNQGKYLAGNKGRLKPGGFYGYDKLVGSGITPEAMQQVAEEMAQTGQGVDWYEFTKILKNRKAKGEL